MRFIQKSPSVGRRFIAAGFKEKPSSRRRPLGDRQAALVGRAGKFRPWKTPEGTVGGILIFSEDITHRKQLEEALLEMSQRLIEAQELERNRIARELHDDIGQRLALLAVELDLLHLEPPESPELLDRMGELQKQASEIATDIQVLSRELHSTRLENLSPFAAMRGTLP